ncbi:hypothetical protein NOR53_451 [gamma proteobacterium NOR5-3]|nr:hypothetical protein NOR53_451 [gamma proteobacterium NOR5-3]
MTNFRPMLSFFSLLIATLVAGVDVHAENSALHEFNFSGEPTRTAYEWLTVSDFSLERHADNPDRIEFYHKDEALHLRVKKPSFGMAVHELDIPSARHLELLWGVSDFPEGASYEHGVDNEAIMLYVFFGHERQPSGEIFVPDSPYFIGFYLCPKGADDVNEPYAGHHYKKTGRYICVEHPAEGETIVSRIDLEEEFRRSFDKPYVPVVSGVSIEVDTTGSGNDGHAAAFIRRLAFYP